MQRTLTASKRQANRVDVLREERQKYVERLKAKMTALPRGSKQWWRINREFLHRKANINSIPPLRQDGAWLVDAKQKADAIANTLFEKPAAAGSRGHSLFHTAGARDG